MPQRPGLAPGLSLSVRGFAGAAPARYHSGSKQKDECAMANSAPKTLYDKIFEDHVVSRQADGTCILYIDRHLVHEVTSPQAFEGLRMAGRKVRAPDKTLAVVDHNIQTTDRSGGIRDPESRVQVEQMAENAREFGIEYYNEFDPRQGVVHIIGP